MMMMLLNHQLRRTIEENGWGMRSWGKETARNYLLNQLLLSIYLFTEKILMWHPLVPTQDTPYEDE